MQGDLKAGGSQLCFGLDREHDEKSLAGLLEMFSNNAFLATIIPRMTDAEIMTVADLLFGLLRAHFSHEEYHKLFLERCGTSIKHHNAKG